MSAKLITVKSLALDSTSYPDNSNYIVKNSNKQLRKVALVCFFTQALCLTCVRMPVRIYHLLALDFVTSGRMIGKEKCTLACIKLGKKLNPNLFIAKEIVKQCIINITQIVTYPLAVIALQFASLLTLIAPSIGRKASALIEHTWSRNGELSKNHYRVTEYFAVCMQPKTVWDKRNIYQAQWSDYKHETIRARLHHLAEFIRKYKDVLKGESRGLFSKANDQVALYRKFVKAVSDNDQNEYSNKRARHSDLALKIGLLHLNLMRIIDLNSPAGLEKLHPDDRAIFSVCQTQIEEKIQELNDTYLREGGCCSDPKWIEERNSRLSKEIDEEITKHEIDYVILKRGSNSRSRENEQIFDQCYLEKNKIISLKKEYNDNLFRLSINRIFSRPIVA